MSTTPFDIGPAAQAMRAIVQQVGSEQLQDRTPCSEWAVADLLLHIQQFASVFTSNATGSEARPPAELSPSWRDEIPDQLARLADAWREPEAWEGQTMAGGISMPASDNALVAVEELTVHAWDLAMSTGQTFRPDEREVELVERFLTTFAGSGADGEGPFGPVAPAPPDADRWEAALASTGRRSRS